MSLTYGFFDSVNHDRTYNAKQFSSIFDGIVKDGVFMSIGDHFVVRPSSGMTISVGTGRAWFNHTWTLNDSLLTLTHAASSPTLGRIDAVVLEINESSNVRANSIKIIKGTPAANPQNPSLIKTDLVHQYPLAYVTIPAGATDITASRINNRVGTSACPYITGILNTVSADSLLAQWDAEFGEWFETVQDILDGDVAGNLTNRILALEGYVGNPKALMKWFYASANANANNLNNPGVYYFSPETAHTATNLPLYGDETYPGPGYLFVFTDSTNSNYACQFYITRGYESGMFARKLTDMEWWNGSQMVTEHAWTDWEQCDPVKAMQTADAVGQMATTALTGLANLSTRVDTNENHISLLQSSVSTMSPKVSALETIVANHTSQISSLQSLTNSLSSQLDSAVSSYDRQLSTLNTAINDTRQQLTTTNQQVARNKNDITALTNNTNNSINTINSSLTSIRSSITSLNNTKLDTDVVETDNLDNCWENGFYHYSSAASHKPTSAGGSLIVSAYNNTNFTQIAFPNQSGANMNIYVRRYDGVSGTEGFTGWYHLTLTA